MEDPNDALHDPDPAADKRKCYTVRRSVALSAYWYERVRQVATSSNLKPGVILRNAIKLGLVQLEQQASPEEKRAPVGRSGAAWPKDCASAEAARAAALVSGRASSAPGCGRRAVSGFRIRQPKRGCAACGPCLRD